jgi:hypothetical protein
VSVAAVGDQSAYLGIEGGSADGVDEYVNGSDGGTMSIDLTGNGEGSGVNMDAVTTIGDPDEPETEYAFKISNQGTQAVTISVSYDFDDGSWINTQSYEPNDQSFMALEAFGEAGPINDDLTNGGGYGRTATFPDQTGAGGNATNSWESKGGPWITAWHQIQNGSRYYELAEGKTWYFTLRVDTTGDDAQMSDNLSGTLKIRADDADD